MPLRYKTCELGLYQRQRILCKGGSTLGAKVAPQFLVPLIPHVYLLLSIEKKLGRLNHFYPRLSSRIGPVLLTLVLLLDPVFTSISSISFFPMLPELICPDALFPTLLVIIT
jgi:hypothetical protein